MTEFIRAPKSLRFSQKQFAMPSLPQPEEKRQEAAVASPYDFSFRTILGWNHITEAMHLVIFVRGLPGVGKTTFAQTCFPDRTLFEADTFAMMEGINSFADRHAACQRALHGHLQSSSAGAIVCNTFTQHEELWSYFNVMGAFAQGRLLIPVVMRLHPGELTDKELADRSRHAVPEYKIREMRRRWMVWPGELTVGFGGALTGDIEESLCRRH